MGFSVYPGERNNSGRKREGQDSPSSLSNTNESEKKPHFGYTVPQEVPYETLVGNANQNAVYWVRLKKAQRQGLQVWKTKSFAFMTYVTTPGDCIVRVTAQNGDRVIFERFLCDTEAAPKVTLKRNWKSQQQQQPISHTDVPSLWKQRGDLGKQSRSARRLEAHHRSGPSTRKTRSNPLLKWMWILISVTKKSTQMHS